MVWARGDLEHALKLRQDGLARARDAVSRLESVDYLHWIGEIFGELERFDEAERVHLEADAICRESAIRSPVERRPQPRGRRSGPARPLSAASSTGTPRVPPARLQRLLAETQGLLSWGLASVLAEVDQDEVAARLWGAVSRRRGPWAFGLVPQERRRYERHLARLESADGWVAGAS